MALLHERGFQWNIHTEGLIMPGVDLRPYVNHWYIKPHFKYQGDEYTLQSDCILFYRSAPNSSFEFHIRGQGDLMAARKYIYKHDLPSEKVYLVPHAETLDGIRELTKMLTKICRQYHCNLAPPMIVKQWLKTK
ncbi:hypothetical protein IIA15_00965 [candidate division TA06 bacterium]|nr:hypothetical protein [candidate division TA06 bacterium]